MTFAKENYQFILSVVDDTCKTSVLFPFRCVQEDVNTMLLYSLNVCMSLIQNRHFRNTVLLLLTKLYMGLKTPDYINVCQVRPALSDHLFPVHLVSMPTYVSNGLRNLWFSGICQLLEGCWFKFRCMHLMLCVVSMDKAFYLLFV